MFAYPTVFVTARSIYSLVPLSRCGVAPEGELRNPAVLVTGTRSSGVHRRRWGSDALVYKQFDFDASILSTSFAGVVLRNRIHFTVAVRRYDATQRNVVVLNQVTNDGISTTLTQRPIARH